MNKMNKMLPLFFKFTSALVKVRNDRLVLEFEDGRMTTHNRIWAKRTEQGDWMLSLHPWIPFRASTYLIQRHIHIILEKKVKYLASDGSKGLAVAMSQGTSRIKAFSLSLKEAIIYSYLSDIRFVILTCLLIGTSMWWMDVPTILFQKPAAFQSPDLGLIVRAVKDAYINNICTTHGVPSPCECGEALNNAARSLFHPESFDPLHIDKTPTMRAIAFHVATIIIALALTESVSTSGILVA